MWYNSKVKPENRLDNKHFMPNEDFIYFESIMTEEEREYRDWIKMVENM